MTRGLCDAHIMKYKRDINLRTSVTLRCENGTPRRSGIRETGIEMPGIPVQTGYGWIQGCGIRPLFLSKDLEYGPHHE